MKTTISNTITEICRNRVAIADLMNEWNFTNKEATRVLYEINRIRGDFSDPGSFTLVYASNRKVHTDINGIHSGIFRASKVPAGESLSDSFLQTYRRGVLGKTKVVIIDWKGNVVRVICEDTAIDVVRKLDKFALANHIPDRNK